MDLWGAQQDPKHPAKRLKAINCTAKTGGARIRSTDVHALGGGFKAAVSATGAYALVYKAYTDAISARGSFETLAQTSEQVAAIITNSIVTPGPELRIQTSKVAKSFAAEKLSGDPDGTLLQRKVRVGTLGL